MPFFFSVPAGDLCIGLYRKVRPILLLRHTNMPPLLSDLHAEITAVISTPQRHASLPDQLRMQPGIADVITVAKAAAQLLAAVFCAGVVIGTLHHIHTPDAVTCLQFFWGKARRRTEMPGNICRLRWYCFSLLAPAFSASRALRRISKALFSSFACAGKRSAAVSRKSRER